MATVGNTGITFDDMGGPEIAELMDEKVGRRKGKWCFYGSFAMHLWAFIANMKSRVPNDIDIAIREPSKGISDSKVSPYGRAVNALDARTETFWDEVSPIDFRKAVETPHGPQSEKTADVYYYQRPGLPDVKVDIHDVHFTRGDVYYFGMLPIPKIELLVGRLEHFRPGATDDIAMLKKIRQALKSTNSYPFSD